jgi:hypothetical protein
MLHCFQKALSWPNWIHHYTAAGGSKTLSVLDSMGESIAYYLGITTPKYQYEIDEFHRAQEEALAKKREADIELASWTTPPNPNGPIETRPVLNQVHSNEGSLPKSSSTSSEIHPQV